jgi:hypothetical protein
MRLRKGETQEGAEKKTSRDANQKSKIKRKITSRKRIKSKIKRKRRTISGPSDTSLTLPPALALNPLPNPNLPLPLSLLACAT